MFYMPNLDLTWNARGTHCYLCVEAQPNDFMLNKVSLSLIDSAAQCMVLRR